MNLLLLLGGCMKDKMMAYLKDESGQTSTEYILLVAVAAAIVIKFKGVITDKLLGDNGILGKVMGKVTDDIENWE
jgi:pilus assembly protein Flp/PilA